MSEQPPVKRRRLNSSLHKPFKSPLRRPLEPKSPNITSTTQLSSTEKATTTTSSQPNKSSSTVKPGTRPIKSSPLHQSHPAPSRPSHHSSTTTTNNKPTYKQAHIRALEASIRTARNDNDTLRQALSILHTQSRREPEKFLPQLIRKWRGAARAAAEDVYAGAREKVHGMGGVGAWRERERERVQRGREWEREEMERERRLEVLRLVAEGMDIREFGIGREEALGESEHGRDYDLDDNRGADVDDDRDGFTIGVMLRSAGIDLGVIGYCPERQAWVDD